MSHHNEMEIRFLSLPENEAFARVVIAAFAVQLSPTVSEIADAMNITRPTATVAINKLEKRGYLEKQPGNEDGRTVRVTLTRSGKRIDHFHRLYHYNMVTKIAENLTDAEKDSLFKGIRKLNEFLKESLGEKK